RGRALQPMTSLLSPLGSCFSGKQRVDLVGLDLVLGDRLAHGRSRHRSVFGQRLQRRHDDVMAVDLEMLAQLAAEVAAPEAVGAEHLVCATTTLTVFWHEGAN